MNIHPFGSLFDAILATTREERRRGREVVLAPVLPNPKRRARKAAERARRAAYVAKHSRRAGEGRHALRNARRKECLRYPLITVDGWAIEPIANRPTTTTDQS